MKKIFGLILCFIMIFSLVACGNTLPPNDGTVIPGVDAETDLTNEEVLKTVETFYADITVKDYGVISLELDVNAAPRTVKNFVTLANEGFYDGLTFHRIMDGFMIQGGDPNGDGSGGSEENIIGEFAANGYENNISHIRGVISMARMGENPFTGELNHDTASSQFFIVHQDSPFLDGQYAAFGHVTSGMEVVDAICAAAQPIDNNGTILPETQPVIESITISY